jgi:hypothetical protein
MTAILTLNESGNSNLKTVLPPTAKGAGLIKSESKLKSPKNVRAVDLLFIGQ